MMHSHLPTRKSLCELSLVLLLTLLSACGSSHAYSRQDTIAENSFVHSDDVIVKQKPTKHVPAFTYIQRLDVLYSVSFPIELIVENRTGNDIRIMSIEYYYERGYKNLKKIWGCNLSINEIRRDSLVWIGEPNDILGIEPFASKRYVVYTEHFVDKDRTFQKEFKSVKEKMKREENKRLHVDYRQCTEQQIHYLKKMIVNDSIRLTIYFNDERHRVKLPINSISNECN